MAKMIFHAKTGEVIIWKYFLSLPSSGWEQFTLLKDECRVRLKGVLKLKNDGARKQKQQEELVGTERHK